MEKREWAHNIWNKKIPDLFMVDYLYYKQIIIHLFEFLDLKMEYPLM